MLDRKPEDYVADYTDYCKDVNIDPNESNSITQYLNEYARWHVMFRGLTDLQSNLFDLEKLLKEKDKYPLDENYKIVEEVNDKEQRAIDILEKDVIYKYGIVNLGAAADDIQNAINVLKESKLVESHLDDYSAEKEYNVTYIDGEGKDKEIKFKPSKNTNIAGIQKELGKKQKDFFKLKDIKECKLTESKKVEEDNKVEDKKLTISERLLLEIIQTVNSKYTLDDVMCQSTPQGNIHITTRDGKDICTVDRREFTISGDDTILIDELRDNGYWYNDLDTLDEEVLVEKEEFDTMAFAQLLPMSYTDYIDNNLSDYMTDGADVEDIIAEYKDGLSDEDKEDFDDNLASQYVKYKLSEGREIKTEGTDLSAKDNTVIVNKNQYGYNTIAIIIDDTNKRFQLVTGQSLPTGKYKKASKKAIRDKAETLKDKGYTEVKGQYSLAESKEVKTEGNYKVSFSGEATVVQGNEEAAKETLQKILSGVSSSNIKEISVSTKLEEASLNDVMQGKALSVKDREILEYVEDRLEAELGRGWRAERPSIIEEVVYDALDQYADQYNEEIFNPTAYYKEIAKLSKSMVTTPMGEFEYEELKALEREMKDAFKDYWAKKISAEDLEATKKKLGRYLTNAQISNCQYDASREADKEKVTESINVGDIFVNEQGAIIKIVEPTKAGEPQYDIAPSSKDFANGKRDCRGMRNYDELSKLLISNGYHKITEAVEEKETTEEIVERAIDEEADAIETYDDLLDGIEDEDLEAVIKEIQKDEEDHKEILKHYDETGEALNDEELEEKDKVEEELEEGEGVSEERGAIIDFTDDLDEVIDGAGYDIYSDFTQDTVRIKIWDGDLILNAVIYPTTDKSAGHETTTIGIGGDGDKGTIYPLYVEGWDYETASPNNTKPEAGQEVYAMFKPMAEVTPQDILEIAKSSFGAKALVEDWESGELSSERDVIMEFADDVEVMAGKAGFNVFGDFTEETVRLEISKDDARLNVVVYSTEDKSADYEITTVGIGGDTPGETVLPKYVDGWDYETASPKAGKPNVGDEVYAIFKPMAETTPEEIIDIVKNAFGISAEDLDTLDDEELLESDVKIHEPVTEYVITYVDSLDEEVFKDQEEADARFEDIKANGNLDKVDQYYEKVWVFEHGGYVEDDVTIFYTKGDELE